MQPLLSRTKVAISPRYAEKPVAEIVEKIVIKQTLSRKRCQESVVKENRCQEYADNPVQEIFNLVASRAPDGYTLLKERQGRTITAESAEKYPRKWLCVLCGLCG